MGHEHLATALSRHYGISPEFCSKYLLDNGIEAADPGSLEAFIEGLGETQRLYLDYALSTNRRGERVRTQFDVGAGAPHRRILDIGCGQGGTVRAFAAAGQEAVGIEIDPGLAEYARLNFGNKKGRIECLDILQCNLEDLGTFDLILCSDVIEHVADPDRMIAITARLLRPGGTFVLQVPNKDSIHQVIADGHFRIAGMTLLSRQEGRELKRHLQGWDDPYHHMGEHLALNHYLQHLRLNGLDPVVDSGPGELAGSLSLFGQACEKIEFLLADDKLSWFTSRELRRAFADYGQRFLAAYQQAGVLGDASAFCRHYLEPTWTIRASKPGEQSWARRVRAAVS